MMRGPVQKRTGKRGDSQARLLKLDSYHATLALTLAYSRRTTDEVLYLLQAQLDSSDQSVPSLVDLVDKRDFLGAATLLQVKRQEDSVQKTSEWLAYCYFHAGQYEKACSVYEGTLNAVNPCPESHTYIAACQFYLGKYDEAEASANKGPPSALQNRILFHCAHACGTEDKLFEHHNKVSKDDLHDQLSLAAIHFRRSHFQEATDIYKRILLEHKNYAALNLYIALCYSRLDYYDISQEILKVCLHTCSKRHSSI
jgi:intraflagellar transport protein 56